MTSSELDRIRRVYAERDERAGPRLWTPSYVGHIHELEWQVLDALRAARVSLAGADLLDIGSGGGYLLHRLAEFGAEQPVGVELSEHRVRRAHAVYPSLDVRVGSASELQFEDASFDIVTQFTVLSSVLDSAMRRSIVREVFRVLRPGGVFVSYDLRPSLRPLRLGRGLLGANSIRGAAAIAPLGVEELDALIGQPERMRFIQLNLDVAQRVGGRRPIVAALRSVRPLRSHILATFRKS